MIKTLKQILKEKFSENKNTETNTISELKKQNEELLLSEKVTQECINNLINQRTKLEEDKNTLLDELTYCHKRIDSLIRQLRDKNNGEL